MSKPLGHKSYGSIPHLSNSRLGPGDHKASPGQERILTEKTRDKHDHIVIQEKLDGSNVAVANVGGQLLAINRSGYLATSSRFEQLHLFAHWVRHNQWRFHFLKPGERVAGEWLAQVHAIHYQVDEQSVFAAFDLMTHHQRAPHQELRERASETLSLAPLIHQGTPLSVSEALTLLGVRGQYGALEHPEGLIYRCERNGNVEFMAKYVRNDFTPGRFIPQYNGGQGELQWNWRPQPTTQPA